MTQGDRIWWTWNGNDLPDDFRLLRVMNQQISSDGCCQTPERIFQTILKATGVFSATLSNFGLGK